nr:amidohydrolase [Desulfurococcus mucosus]
MKCFLNGRVYTGFKPLRVEEALTVAYGRVLYAGEEGKALALCRMLGGEAVDLEGKTILPGFIDSHMHLDGVGLQLSTLDLRGVGSIEELKEKVREYAASHSGGPVVGRGWDQEFFREKRWPTRWDLDEAVVDRPVILVRVCGHAAVLNTKAMELAGLIHVESPWVVRDESGEATGVILEGAVGEALRVLQGSMDTREKALLMRRALEYAASLGVTTLGFMSCSGDSLRALMLLHSEWRYPRVRVYVEPGLLRELSKLGFTGGFGSEYLRVKGVKAFADGSLGARTAWLSKPYSDDPLNTGRQLISRSELEGLVEEASRAGFQVAVHAIGDAAVDLVLDVYRSARGSGVRHRIEHASVIRPEQVAEASSLGIAVSVQPRFAVSDWWAGQRLGDERLKWLYPFKTMAGRGVALGFSTDAPVEPLNPWETIYAAVAREGGEALTLEEALHYYTYGSAYVLGEEGELGTLTEGKLADLIVVDRDPFKTPLGELRGIRVVETYVGGERVLVQPPS